MLSNNVIADRPLLFDLVEHQQWQRLQDHFSTVLGIAIRTIHPSRELLTSPSWPIGVAPEQAVELLNVGEEVERLVPLDDPPLEISSITTSLGVTYAAVPIFATAPHVVALFIVGPMVVGPREEKAQFRQRVLAMGMDAQVVWNLLLSLKPSTYASIHSLLNLLQEVGTSLVQFAYQASRLATILPSTERIDQVVEGYYTDRVLTSLLEVATLATRAEGGSVMLADRSGETLRIRAAQGLSDAVVAESHQQRHEGIAGLAISRRAIILVDEQTDDAPIQTLMRRKELVSSLVAPLSLVPSQQPVGILSLRTTNRERRFTQEHVEMLRRLLDLAGIALGNLRLTFTK